MAGEIYLSREGYEKLREELDRLKTVKRRELSKAIIYPSLTQDISMLGRFQSLLPDIFIIPDPQPIIPQRVVVTEHRSPICSEDFTQRLLVACVFDRQLFPCVETEITLGVYKQLREFDICHLPSHAFTNVIGSGNSCPNAPQIGLWRNSIIRIWNHRNPFIGSPGNWIGWKVNRSPS